MNADKVKINQPQSSGSTEDIKEVESRLTNHDSRLFGTAKTAKKNQYKNGFLSRNLGDGRLERHTGRG
jgi:excinuclease UvrABC ATPase subunit